MNKRTGNTLRRVTSRAWGSSDVTSITSEGTIPSSSRCLETEMMPQRGTGPPSNEGEKARAFLHFIQIHKSFNVQELKRAPKWFPNLERKQGPKARACLSQRQVSYKSAHHLLYRTNQVSHMQVPDLQPERGPKAQTRLSHNLVTYQPAQPAVYRTRLFAYNQGSRPELKQRPKPPTKAGGSSIVSSSTNQGQAPLPAMYQNRERTFMHGPKLSPRESKGSSMSSPGQFYKSCNVLDWRGSSDAWASARPPGRKKGIALRRYVLVSIFHII